MIRLKSYELHLYVHVYTEVSHHQLPDSGLLQRSFRFKHFNKILGPIREFKTRLIMHTHGAVELIFAVDKNHCTIFTVPKKVRTKAFTLSQKTNYYASVSDFAAFLHNFHIVHNPFLFFKTF